MLRNARDAWVVWEIDGYLRERHREIKVKYDFRYSVLMFVFIGLHRESWLTDEDLVGLSQDKIEPIKRPLG